MKQSVMFIGDGINDSPVLAQADVGVAINSGSDITINAAGIVLMKDSLTDVINALRISKMSFKRIKINFVWAFLYNLLLIPISMGILYPIKQFRMDPMLAGAAMALSSISVVISSLMLKFYRPITIVVPNTESNLEVSV
jgi:P-type Cu+ transporter